MPFIVHDISSPTGTSPRQGSLVAAAVIFFLTGMIFAVWASRIPAIKQQLGVTDGELAFAFAALNAGAVIGLQFAGFFVARVGSRRVLQIALPLFALALLGPALANSLLLLCGAVFVFALTNSLVDVAMNAQGVEAERQLAKPMLSRFHAMHSLGMIAGSAGGALAIQQHLSLTVYFGVAGVVVAAVGLAVTSRLATGHGDEQLPLPARSALETAQPGPLRRTRHLPMVRWPRVLLVLGVLGFCVTFAEGAANDWVAVYLHDTSHASATTAAAAFGVFAAAMVVGRLAGDRLAVRFGPVRAFRMGSLAAGAGFGLSLLYPHPAVAVAGIVVLGLGISYALPLALSAAAQSATDEGSAATAVARTSTLSYLGSFVGPAVIGPVAAAASLTLALSVPAVLVLGASLGARALRPTTTGATSTTDCNRSFGSQSANSWKTQLERAEIWTDQQKNIW
jgi:predicted MFS family arabinose efflux permease